MSKIFKTYVECPNFMLKKYEYSPIKFSVTNHIHKNDLTLNDPQELEMDTATRVQILDEADCISYTSNTIGKGMNPISLPPAMGK